MEYTKYAAVGHFKCHRTLAGKKYPVVIVGQKEYMLDVQEMTVWSSPVSYTHLTLPTTPYV